MIKIFKLMEGTKVFKIKGHREAQGQAFDKKFALVI